MRNKILNLSTLLLILTLMFSVKQFVVEANDWHAFYYNQTLQAKSNWCWVASAENSVRWERSISRNQYDAVKKIKGWFFNPYPNKGGTLSEMKKAAEYISKDKETYKATSLSTSGGVKTFSFLKSEVKNSDVTLLVAGYYSGGSRNGGHAVTCTGYYIENGIQYLRIYDPWDGTISKVTYNYFKNGWGGRKYDGTVYNAE